MNQGRRCALLAVCCEPSAGEGVAVPDQNTQCTQRRYQNRGRESVGGEIGDFSHSDCGGFVSIPLIFPSNAMGKAPYAL